VPAGIDRLDLNCLPLERFRVECRVAREGLVAVSEPPRHLPEQLAHTSLGVNSPPFVSDQVQVLVVENQAAGRYVLEGQHRPKLREPQPIEIQALPVRCGLHEIPGAVADRQRGQQLAVVRQLASQHFLHHGDFSGIGVDQQRMTPQTASTPHDDPSSGARVLQRLVGQSEQASERRGQFRVSPLRGVVPVDLQVDRFAGLMDHFHAHAFGTVGRDGNEGNPKSSETAGHAGAPRRDRRGDHRLAHPRGRAPRHGPRQAMLLCHHPDRLRVRIDHKHLRLERLSVVSVMRGPHVTSVEGRVCDEAPHARVAPQLAQAPFLLHYVDGSVVVHHVDAGARGDSAPERVRRALLPGLSVDGECERLESRRL
jgi:hypothetical protein